MKTQAWAWLTAGVVALGLNGFYHDGGAAWAHRIAERVSDRSDFVVQRVSDRADQFLAEVRMAGVRDETASCRMSTALAQFQTRMARTQNRLAQTRFAQTRFAQTRFADSKIASFDRMTAREEAQVDRLEASQERAEAQVEAQVDAQVVRMRFAPVVIDRAAFKRVVIDPIRIRVACPQVRVNVPAVRIPVVSVPRMPAIRIPAPVISISGAESDSSPI
jgi:hypothetical protein